MKSRVDFHIMPWLEWVLNVHLTLFFRTSSFDHPRFDLYKIAYYSEKFSLWLKTMQIQQMIQVNFFPSRAN
jgi:hypothetical protein